MKNSYEEGKAILAAKGPAALHEFVANVLRGDNEFVPGLVSFDPSEWAFAFIEAVKGNPAIATDQETITKWFADALMRGYVERGNETLRSHLPPGAEPAD